MSDLQRLSALAEYLRRDKETLDDIMQFTALNTFSESGVIAMFLATIKRNGLVAVVARYGVSDEAFAKIPDGNVSVDVPVNTALRTGAILECGSSERYVFAGKDYRDQLFPNGFASSIAFPVPGIGAAIIYCAKPFELSLKSREFLLIVGRLLSLEIWGVREFDVDDLDEPSITSIKGEVTASEFHALG